MDIRKDLLKQLETVDGESLLPHHQRQALVFIGDELDIIDVGIAFATDNKDSVTTWLQTGDIWKCTEKDKQAGALNSTKSYQFLILQPFVLAKAVATH